MQKYIIYTLAVTIIILFAGVSVKASPKDISRIVKDETSLDEHIVLFCLEYCQGNQRKGYLKSLFVDKIGTGHYRVTGRAAPQNRHIINNPLEFVLYDHTVIINAFATLTSDNCELRVDNVFIQNDINNIFNTLLKNNSDVIGRKETIPDCNRFLK